MKRLLIVLLALLTSACATKLPIDYKGADAGTVIVGLGATDTQFQSWTLLFRRKGDATKAIGSFYYQKKGFLGTGTKPDYESDDKGIEEHGVVLAASLPPGDYELYGVSEFLNGGTIQITYTSREPLSMPFTVRRGTVAYLGNYQATSFKGRNLIGIPVVAGAFYAVEDRRLADMAIAVQKGLVSGRITVEDFTPASATLTGQVLVTPAERDRRRPID